MPQERGLRDKLRRAVARERESHLVASCIAELARFLAQAGRLAEASTLYAEAIAMRARLAGDPTSSLAHDLLHAGEVARRAEDFAVAEDLLTRALAAGEKSSQPLVVLNAARELGETYAANNRVEEASDAFERALEVCRGYFRDDVLAYAPTLLRCARLAVARGRDTLAMTHYTLYVAFGLNRGFATELADAMRELAAVYRRLGEETSARVLEENLEALTR